MYNFEEYSYDFDIKRSQYKIVINRYDFRLEKFVKIKLSKIRYILYNRI